MPTSDELAGIFIGFKPLRGFPHTANAQSAII
jgi:hypothetical protein